MGVTSSVYTSRKYVRVLASVVTLFIFTCGTSDGNTGVNPGACKGEFQLKESDSDFDCIQRPTEPERLKNEKSGPRHLYTEPYVYSVESQLKASEANWIRSQERRKLVVHKVRLSRDIDRRKRQTIWDFFYPSFDCPFTKERIGRVGDGGKWICGFDLLETKPDCTVFSFGVGGDTSFEDEFLHRTQSCIVHMFDPTIRSVPDVVQKYPGRAFFHFLGISGTNVGNYSTLKSIMEDLKVTKLDVLKMDVEGAEWEAMPTILNDFPEKLPFAQLQIELHLEKGKIGKFRKRDWLTNVGEWWEKLETAGLRPFNVEANLVVAGKYFVLREFGFLNTQMEPFKLSQAISINFTN